MSSYINVFIIIHNKIYILTTPNIIIGETMKDQYIRIMVTPEQKDFIQTKAQEEMRTMTAIINKSLKTTYNDYPVS